VAERNSIDLEQDPAVMVGTRVLDAPRTLVFDMWSDPKHLAQWWGPNGFSTTTNTFDLRPGGVWRFVMHGPDGRNYDNRIEFEEVVRPERIVYRHRGEDAEPVQLRTTVTFEDLGGRTRLTLHARFPSGKARDRVIGEFGADRGMVQTLARLAEYLGRIGKAWRANSARHLMPKYELTKPDQRALTLARTFEAPRCLVFDAFTKPEMVKQWLWGPPEWPMVHCEIDLRVGGKLRYVWRHVTRGEMGMSGVFHDIKVPELLVNTELFDEDWTGGETLVTTTFREHDGRTVVSATVRYASQAARDDALKTDMLEGWSQGHDRLDEMLTALGASTAQ
jgi:uncharacterized protein YndB with AHSA1/START domain